MTIDEAKNKEFEEANRLIDNASGHCARVAKAMLKNAGEKIQLAEWLEDYKKLREAIEWIATKDKRPTENQIVLTCDLKGWISTDIYNSSSMHRWNSGFYVAWMPLPKPYKEQQVE